MWSEIQTRMSINFQPPKIIKRITTAILDLLGITSTGTGIGPIII